MEFQDEAILDRRSRISGYPDAFLWVIVLGSYRYNKYNTVKYSCARVQYLISVENPALL